jgi:NTE family protein
VVLGKGDLARSIRASMAVPVAFAAVKIDGRLLVDGMLAGNVPIDVARAMGADIVIVVDVGEPLLSSDDIGSLFGVLGQVATLLSRRNVDEQLKTLTPRDILITPTLGSFSSGDFAHAAEAIAIGFEAAEKARPQLESLAGSIAVAEHVAPAAGIQSTGAPVIEFVRIESNSPIAEAVILKKLAVRVGEPLNRDALQQGISDLYGLELFSSVRYEIVSDGEKLGLLVTIDERHWGPDYLKFGLALSSDFEGESLWNIGASYRKTALNGYAGEALIGIQLGEDPIAALDLYQPLDRDLRWFIDPTLLFRAGNVSRYENNDQVEEFRVNRYGGSIAGGRELGRWGEARVGLRRFAGDIDVRIGDPTLPSDNFDSAEVFIKLSYDTLDNRNFPHYGGINTVEWVESVESIGADSNFTQLNVSTGGVHTWSGLTVGGGVEFNYTAHGMAPVQNRYRSGGFTRLSGFAEHQLSGQQVLLFRSFAYQHLAKIKLLLVYIGGSLEIARIEGESRRRPSRPLPPVGLRGRGGPACRRHRAGHRIRSTGPIRRRKRACLCRKRGRSSGGDWSGDG